VRALGIQRRRHVWTTVEVRELRRLIEAGASRRGAARLMRLTMPQVVGAMKQYRIRVPKRRLTRVRDPLLDKIRQRAQALNITLADLNRATKSLFFWKTYNRGGISLRRARKVAPLLGGRLTVEWDAD
jgi:hypothetical protein